MDPFDWCIDNIEDAKELAYKEAWEIFKEKELLDRAAIEGYSFGNEVIYYSLTLKFL